MSVMTDEEYVKQEGAVCPFCTSADTATNGGLHVDSAGAWQECSCNACDKAWTDQYVLTGYNPTG